MLLNRNTIDVIESWQCENSFALDLTHILLNDKVYEVPIISNIVGYIGIHYTKTKTLIYHCNVF